MSNRILFGLSLLGLLAGLLAAYVFGVERRAQPPLYAPVSNPYASAIYANGIIESVQPGGANINLYPEVAGPVTAVLVREGQPVKAGAPLLAIDDVVQRAGTEQLRLQSEAARALLRELRAQPRRETLQVSLAQVAQAEAAVRTARAQYDKRRLSSELDPRSLSRDVLDSARGALDQAVTGLDVARRQYQLLKAGAWSYDVASQARQYEAARQAYLAADALLRKHTLTALADGVVLAINASPGSYVSPQGAYDSYTGASAPPVVMGAPQDVLAVRCYVDEILVSRLPAPGAIQARMVIRGSGARVPLEFVRVQPYVQPKIQLSNQRQEKVDLRVLAVLFRFHTQGLKSVYPGQLVDVYIGPK